VSATLLGTGYPLAKLARAVLTLDWMPGAIPRCGPVDIKRNRHGDHPASALVGAQRASPGRK
jgi:hypothetical protein